MNAESRVATDIEELEGEWGYETKRWRLPCRQLGAWRRLGWFAFVPLVASVPFALGVTQFFGTFLRVGANGANNGGNQWIFLLFLVPFAIAFLVGLYFSLKILTAGLCILREQSRTELELNESKLSVFERFYWVRFKRQLKDAKSIRYLRVVTTEDLKTLRKTTRFGKENPPIGNFVPGEINYALVANTPGDSYFIVAALYPRAVLEQLQSRLETALGGEVASQKQANQRLNAVGNDETREVNEELGVGTGPGDDLPVDKPTESKITIERRQDGITLSIPKQGLFRGSRGLFFFALIWNLFILVFVLMIVLAKLGLVKGDDNADSLGAIFGIGLFQLIGLGLLAASLYLGTRRSTVATSYGMLLISTQSIFGKKTKSWEAEQIDTIDYGPSGMEVNDVPVMQLQVHETQGKKYGALSQLTNSELEWVAYELRQSLSLRPSVKEPLDAETIQRMAVVDHSGSIVFPEGSRLILEEAGEDWTVRAPANVNSQSIFGAVVGLLFASIGAIVPIFVFWGAKREIVLYLFFLVWSGGFISIGLFVFLYNLGTLFSRYEIVCRHRNLTVRRLRPWGTKSCEFSLDQPVDLKVAPLLVQQGNDQSKFQLAISSGSSNQIRILPHWPARDLAFVLSKIEHANREAMRNKIS